MSNDQSNAQQGTNPDRVGQQISLHQADGDTSTWVTMNVESNAPITVNAFTTAPITVNTYAGTAIKINAIDPPASGQVATLQDRETSDDSSEEVEENYILSAHSFQHVHWTPSGYVDDNLAAVANETAVASQPGVESDSSDYAGPATPDFGDSEVSESDEGEDEDDNRSTTAEIGEPTESNLPASGDLFRLDSHLRPISTYPFLPISTNFLKCGISNSRQRGSAWKRCVLCVESRPLDGSPPTYSCHWPGANGRLPVKSWEFVLVIMKEDLMMTLYDMGLPTKRSSWDEFLNVTLDPTIDLQPDFTLPENAGYRVLAWAKQPRKGGEYYWLDIQGRVVEETSDFRENHDPWIHVSKRWMVGNMHKDELTREALEAANEA